MTDIASVASLATGLGIIIVLTAKSLQPTWAIRRSSASVLFVEKEIAVKRLLMLSVLVSSLGWTAGAQQQVPADTPAPVWDARQFIIKNHIHQISGVTALTAAAFTGVAGASLAYTNGFSGLKQIHHALALTTVATTGITLALGLTAYSDRLDEVWPHAALMGLAETGFILNAFVLEPGSTPHRITGAVSITSLFAGLAAIIVIKSNEKNQ